MALAEHPDPQGAAPRNQALSGNALAVGSILLWAAGFPAAEILLDDWRPEVLITARLAMAMALLVPLWMAVDGAGFVLRARWLRGVWVGLVSFGLGTYMLLVAQWFTDPVTVALIASATPISATVIEILGGQRRMTAAFALGLAASVAGGLIATGGSLSPGLGWGVLLAIASGVLFSWGSNAAVRDFPELSPIGRSTITLAGALAFCALLLAGCVLAGVDVLPKTPVTSHQIGLLAIYAFAALALSQVMFIASVGRLGVAVTCFHINVAPFYVMLILYALGGDWSWVKAAGAALVAAGVVLSQFKRRRVRTGPPADAV